MIKVLVVDDSALIRSLLSEIIKSDAELQLIGAAADAYQAKDLVNQYRPDVITLDVEMPKVDGLTFLDRLMKARPTPVLMISTLTEQGAEVTLRALELGAVDYIAKPRLDVAAGIEAYRHEIISKIKTVAQANVSKRKASQPVQVIKPPAKLNISEKVLAIGASTGGTEAIKTVLMALPSDCPGVLVTQHMPAGFTHTFAERLNKQCPQIVKEAEHNERVIPGHVYIAPGSRHLELVRSGADFRIQLNDAERVSGHKPSVDVLFRSVAQAAGPNAVAMILTGMGKDGAFGVQDIHHAGGYVLAQDEESCIVFGMPREAIQTGVVDEVCSLDQIARQAYQELARRGGYRL
jgi:two-component system chemotaxis response regulator CheB